MISTLPTYSGHQNILKNDIHIFKLFTSSAMYADGHCLDL
ncbi:hypothetical protein VO64_0074 [Pseudomonas synxantha]|uniref:Uncharacterized protein n=1 Tax=Pseudomonas synxantha TaxID=47883 RepID=A0AAU8TP68_9PSED|nr:hypothetical protein VO64_0074 [Pseudomonas synxantha]